MTFRTRLFGFFIFLGMVCWLSWNIYGYFFSQTEPSFEIHGLVDQGCYAGETNCIVRAQDNYKVGDITVKLDGKQLAKTKASQRTIEYPLAIDTESLTDGRHSLEVEVANSTYRQAKKHKGLTFFVDNMPLHAALMPNNRQKISQGRTIKLKFQVNKAIAQAIAHAFGADYTCVLEGPRSLIYECFIPVDCEEEPDTYPIVIEITDKVGNTVELEAHVEVIKFPFKRQRLRISSEKIKAENEAGLSEKELEIELAILAEKSPKEKLWQGAFYTPIEITDKKQITTEYGVIRTTQERGLRQHKALDVYTTPKSVVWATQDGIVVIKNRYAHSGNTVVLDHGCGVFTLYFHLDSCADIEVGDKLKRGNPVGKLGKTGYATGYHLHWEMRIHNIPVDPMQWAKADF